MNTDRFIRRKPGCMSYFEGGTGTPILFLHGFPGSAYSWLPVASILLDRYPDTYRFLLPDLLGFGESNTSPEDWHMEKQAQAVADLLRHLGIQDLYLATHDFGGPVSLVLLRLHPEIRIRRLILSATNIFTDTPIPLPLRSAGIPLLGDLVYRLMAGSVLGFRMIHRAAARNKKAFPWQTFRRHATRQNLASTARIFQRNLADLPGNYQRVQTIASQNQVPTLLLWGDRDPFFPLPVARRAASVMPNSTLKIYKQTGHFVPEERPLEAAEDLLDFFSAGPSASIR